MAGGSRVWIVGSMLLFAMGVTSGFQTVHRSIARRKDNGRIFVRSAVNEAAFLVAKSREAVAWWEEDRFVLVLPVVIVGSLLLILSVVTVETAEEGRRPPPERMEELPRLRDWSGVAGQRADLSRNENIDIVGLESAADLLRATLFQWKVFAETNHPVGFYGQDDNAVLELLRALYGFFSYGLANQKKYEAYCRQEVAVGASKAYKKLPEPLPFDVAAPRSQIVQKCIQFVPELGISIAAKFDDSSFGGLTTLRVRSLPPFRDDDQDFVFVGYLNSLAVARTARRSGVATSLVDFSIQKAKAWGCRGLCLHVNKLNTPALRFYAATGFEIIQDWLGFYPSRFLLLLSFYPEDEHRTSSFYQKQIHIDAEVSDEEDFVHDHDNTSSRLE